MGSLRDIFATYLCDIYEPKIIPKWEVYLKIQTMKKDVLGGRGSS